MLTVIDCVNGRDLAAQSLHAEGGHCVADITCFDSAIDYRRGYYSIAVQCDALPGCDLMRLSASAILSFLDGKHPHDWQRPGRESLAPRVRPW